MMSLQVNYNKLFRYKRNHNFQRRGLQLKLSRRRNFWSLRKWGYRRYRFFKRVKQLWWARLQRKRGWWYARRRAFKRAPLRLARFLKANLKVPKTGIKPKADVAVVEQFNLVSSLHELISNSASSVLGFVKTKVLKHKRRMKKFMRSYLRPWGFLFTRRRPARVRFMSRQRRRFKIYRSFAHQTRFYPHHRLLRSEPEMPRYVNYRQLFQNQIYEKQSFRKLFRFTQWQLVKHYRQALTGGKRLFDMLLIKYFEFRLDTIVYRANMAFTHLQSRQFVKAGRFLVNDRVMTRPNFRVTIGDCILPQLNLLTRYLYHAHRLYYRPVQPGQYPDYLMLNERVPVAIVVDNPNVQRLYYTLPVSWQFLMLSLAGRYR